MKSHIRLLSALSVLLLLYRVANTHLQRKTKPGFGYFAYETYIDGEVASFLAGLRWVGTGPLFSILSIGNGDMTIADGVHRLAFAPVGTTIDDAILGWR